MILESEDLPVIPVQKSHEELAEYKQSCSFKGRMLREKYAQGKVCPVEGKL